jgi:hypothetical protein
MFRIVLKELFIDVRSVFRGWYRLLVIFFLAILVGVSISGEKYLVNLYLMYFIMMINALIKPKLNKIQYLLPSDAGDRQKYIIFKCLGILVIYILIYTAAYTMNVFLGKYSVLGVVRNLFLQSIPFVVAYSFSDIASGYNMSNNQFKKVFHKHPYVMMFLTLIIPMLHGTLLSQWEAKSWYFISAIIAYIVSFYGVYLHIRMLKHVDTSYDNIKKVAKFI